MSRAVADVASLFNAPIPAPAPNVPEEVYPGYPGLVFAGGELRSMTWGFPRVMLSKKTGLPLKPKPVNNARDDKLLTPFWRSAFERRRCLIPVSQWAEAEGETGRMTRTWYSLHGSDLFAVAGLWRPTQEWGDAYTMVMVDGCAQMADVHDRMPVILRREHWTAWTDGTPDDALQLAATCDATLVIDRTPDLWFKPRGA